MEIKGDEFIKNVKYQQEKEELEDRISELEAQNGVRPSNNPYEQSNPFASNNSVSYEEEVSKTESELDDILLGANTHTQNQDNKKKYIILGLVLAILFLITIIIFRLLSNESNDSNLKDKETLNADKPLNNSIEQQYQKIVNEKLKSIEDMKSKTEAEEKKINESLDLNNIQKEEKKITLPTPTEEEIQKAEELKKDIFNVKEEVKKAEPVKAITKPVVEKKVEPVVTKPVIQKTTQTTTANKPSGTFIQVGAFSKSIDKDYMTRLNASGLKYTMYKVDVKGITYNKVLVGPYKSREEAMASMNSVKSKLGIASAFVLKL